MNRRLTDEARRAIRRLFYELIDDRLSGQEQARVMAERACALLELGEEHTRGWWEEPR